MCTRVGARDVRWVESATISVGLWVCLLGSARFVVGGDSRVFAVLERISISWPRLLGYLNPVAFWKNWGIGRLVKIGLYVGFRVFGQAFSCHEFDAVIVDTVSSSREQCERVHQEECAYFFFDNSECCWSG